MRQYVVNLTDNLIGKNQYDQVIYRIPNRDEFVQHVKIDLEAGDIAKMSPETLGKIICSFEIGDVMASSKELLGTVKFGGDCEGMFRELVALCLAFAIRDRLSEERLPGIPRWEGRLPKFQSSAREIIDRVNSASRKRPNFR